MSKKIYNKLIRDKIPEVIKKKGGIPKTSILDEAEFRKALKVKMTEESKALLEAESNDEVLNELSDIEELIRATAKNYGLSLKEIEKHRIEKLQERGGFDKKLFLEYVEEKQICEANYWKNKWSNRPLEPANNFAKRAYELIKAKNYKTLLDLGCGDGRDSIYFSNKGIKVTALDFSESGINKLKNQNSKIDCIFEDIRNTNFRENYFDVIYAHLSLHYFNDETTSKIFDNLFRILKKGGLIFIKCKSVDDELFGKGEKIGGNMFSKGHIRHFFTKEYMTENLKKFKIIKVRKTSSVYHEYKSAFIEAVATK